MADYTDTQLHQDILTLTAQVNASAATNKLALKAVTDAVTALQTQNVAQQKQIDALIAGTTVPPTPTPTAPTALVASAKSATSVALTWVTPTVGTVTGYQILRNGAVLATTSTTATSYDDNAVVPSTTYSYTVKAVLAGGALSPASKAATATTPAVVVPPAGLPAPVGVTAVVGTTGVTVTWSPVANVATDDYILIRDGAEIGHTVSSGFVDTPPPGTYAYTVEAFTAAATSPPSAPVSVTVGTVTPPPVDPPPVDPPPAGTRNGFLWPFSPQSPFNTPIGSGAQFEAATGPKTSAFRNWNGDTWINCDAWSVPTYQATTNDPLVTVTDVVHGKSTQVRVPAAAVPAAGSDSNMAIVQPKADGRTIDMWIARWTGPNSIDTDRYNTTPINGMGIGPQAGIRASAVSTLGGLIRRWEVDPSDSNYTDGVIRHALAVAMPWTAYLHTTGNSGYDAQGYGTAKGYQWPATEQDWGSEYNYGGPIPLGSLAAIPKSVNITSLGLPPAAVKIAKAAQDYGIYFLDNAGSFSFYAEPTLAGSAWINEAIGDYNQLVKIRKALVIITNSSATSVGGGGTYPIALAPPLA